MLICHLSDIHFRSDKENTIINKAEKIKEVIVKESINEKVCLIIISGDIAFSGSSEEYIIAYDFISSLEKLKKPDGCFENLDFVIVPGNHDCNFLLDDGVRAALLRDITVNKCADKHLIDKCTQIQKDFFDFYEVIKGKVKGNSIHKLEEFNVEGKRILINSFNSAWMSQKSEKYGDIIIPIKQLEEFDPVEYDVVISVFHHPYFWLNQENRVEFNRFLQEKSDIIITGHEHISDQINIETSATYSNEIYAGGVLQYHNNDKESTFNIIKLDFENKKELFTQYTWDESIYRPSNECNEWKKFSRNKYIEKNSFHLSSDFSSRINDIGAKLDHPYKDNLILDDIYIYPNLKVISTEEKKEDSSAIVDSKNVYNFIIENKKILITGESNSGKTSLARILIKKFLNDNIVGVLVDAFEIRKPSVSELGKIIIKKFDEQYSQNLQEEFKQLPKNRKAIIIDDFHNINLNSTGRNTLIELLYELFDIVVIFASDSFRIEHLINKSISIDLMNITNCVLLDFGYYLRSQIIRKWYTIGREFTASEMEINHKCICVEKIIDNLVGRNLLPSYPIYILLILQQLETANNLNTNLSSYGYLYQMLINKSLISINSNSSIIDINDTYLTELAYYVFKKTKMLFDEEDIKKVTNYYNMEYSQNVSYPNIIANFIKAKILDGNLQECRFKYKYIYYYYVAKYLTNNIERSEIKDHIMLMSKKLYNEEYANIMIFLCHLTKNPYVIEELVLNAMLIYEKYSPYDFDNHLPFIKSISKLSVIKLPSGNVESNRETYLRQKDRIKDESKDSDDIDLDNEDDEISDLLLINRAFKTIQILGQILKNYPGSIPGRTRYDVALECELLAMRTLNVLLTLTNDNFEGLVDSLVKIHQEKELDSNRKEQIREQAKAFILKIIEIVALGMVRKVADSIANQELNETYREILEKNKQTSFYLINISTKMNSLNIFPISEIIFLAEKLKEEKNLFSFTILRRLVTQYFYLHHCDYNKKQKVCDKLDIFYKNTMVMENMGKKYKRLF